MRWFHLLLFLSSLCVSGYTVYSFLKPTMGMDKLGMSIMACSTSLIIMITSSLKSRPDDQVFLLVGMINCIIGLNMLMYHFMANVLDFEQDEIGKLNYVFNMGFSFSASLMTLYILIRSLKHYSSYSKSSSSSSFDCVHKVY